MRGASNSISLEHDSVARRSDCAQINSARPTSLSSHGRRSFRLIFADVLETVRRCRHWLIAAGWGGRSFACKPSGMAYLFNCRATSEYTAAAVPFKLGTLRLFYSAVKRGQMLGAKTETETEG